MKTPITYDGSRKAYLDADGVSVPFDTMLTAVNSFPLLVNFLSEIILMDHPDAEEHNLLCANGTRNVDVLTAIDMRACELHNEIARIGREASK